MEEIKYRIAIVGTSGSGKSTLAREVSEIVGCPHIEMDNHSFLPRWQKKEDHIFVEHIEKLLEQKNWVSCGNYSIVRDSVWKRATHLVWINLPFWKVFWQVLVRTFKRILTREEIAGGNFETIKRQFFSRQSIFLWVITTHKRRSRVYSKLIEERAYPNLKVSILTSNKKIKEWLNQLKKGEI